jgi:two-component system CheB/CheR fusion protein
VPGHLVIKKATFSKAKIKIITGSNLSLEQIVASRKIFFDEQGKLAEVFSLLYKANKIDFTNYKQTTVKRRIIRRMGINRIERFADYIAHLKLHPTELIALAQDILIHVTNFFREPVTFHELKNKVFPNLANQRPPNSAIRIWVPGCSTGEEAYSIAITLVEYLEDQGITIPIQIFATDINANGIDVARRGIYPENITKDISAERLVRFFTKLKSGYQINKEIRDLCIFAPQNVFKDPPFSQMDLISCRNVLIYFGPVLQRKVIPIFHYALKSTGYLMLGSSESIGIFADLFTLLDKKNKIYRKKALQTPLNFDFRPDSSRLIATVWENDRPMDISKDGFGNGFDVQREADRIVLAKYAPNGVVINDNLEILQFRGKISPYIEPAPGVASFNLLKMIRAELVTELCNVIHQAGKINRPVRHENISFKYNKQKWYVNIEVFPFKTPAMEKTFFLIVFEDISKPNPISFKKVKLANPKLENHNDYEIVRLKQELAATIEYQQSIIEERESANEELRATNEEIQSSNEELQSTYEEMETAKEELQATNAELTTVNDELHHRNLELGQANNDLSNLLSCINLPIVILGSDLRIRRFTPMAEKLLNFIPADVGRPFSDIKPNIVLPHLEQTIREVMDTLTIFEKEVQDRLGRWYSMGIRPYKTSENKIDGVVITFFNIDTLKINLTHAQEVRDYTAIIETVRGPFLILDAKLQVKMANRSFYDTFRVTPQETKNESIFTLGNGQWNIPELRVLLEDILPRNTSFKDFKVDHCFPMIGRKIMLLNAHQVIGAGNVTKMILLAFEDITMRET